MNTRQVATALGVHPSRVRQLAAAGRLIGASREGRDWDIPTSTVARVLAERSRPARTRPKQEQR